MSTTRRSWLVPALSLSLVAVAGAATLACGGGGRSLHGENEATSALDGGPSAADEDADAGTPAPVVDPCGPQGAPWAMSGRCPTRGGQAPFAGPASGSVKRWETLIDGKPSEATVGRDGTVYVGSSGPVSALWAIDAGGRLRWTFRAEHSYASDKYFTVAAIGWDDTIYAVADDARLYAIDHATGEKKWAASVGWTSKHTTQTPVLAPDGTIYYASLTSVYAIDSNGNTKWTWTPSSATTSGSLFTPSLTADGSTLFVGSSDGTLSAVQTSDGTSKWAFTGAGGFAWAAPAVDAQGRVYAFSTDGAGSGSRGVKLVAVDASGSQAWALGFPGVDRAGAVTVDGSSSRIYAVAGRAVHAIDATGHVTWSYSAPGDVVGQPVVDAKGNVYVSVQYTGLVALASDGSTLFTSKLDGIGSSPALGADGTLYVGASHVDENGTLLGTVLAVAP